MVRNALPNEREAVLTLLLSHLSPLHRKQRVESILQLMNDGTIDPAGLFTTDDFSGATLASPTAGAGGILWPPICISDSDASRLIESACAWLRLHGSRLVQIIISKSQSYHKLHLTSNGFSYITELVTLVHELTRHRSLLRFDERLKIDTYSENLVEDFKQTLLRSYENSLDCPEIVGLRSIEEILAGHRAQGQYEPLNWWLARQNNQAIGVVIQVDHNERKERELAYIGIIPEMRGMGLGRQLMQRIIGRAKADGMRRVILGLDSRNIPAWHLYTRLGFEEVDREQVFLRIGP